MSQESLSEPSKYFKEWTADAYSIQTREIEQSIYKYFSELGLVLMEPELKYQQIQRNSFNLLIDRNQLIQKRVPKRLKKPISTN